MRQEHLELLCCPLSLEPLSLEVDERADDGSLWKTVGRCRRVQLDLRPR